MAKVFVAMSGGVDSSAAAYLLLRQGYEVCGITMSILKSSDNQAVKDAKRIADALQIKHYTFELQDEFDKLVVEPFVLEYLSGRTPNPCVLCNRGLKWGLLLEKALELGADCFATGHYASIVKLDERYAVRNAGAKDQSYALYGLTQEQLKRTVFPLGSYTKDEVRSIVKEEARLDVFDKPESQEICFVEDDDHSGFIERFTGRTEREGEFVLADGTVLGFHKGISKYTIGQRKGLGISYGEPLFVQKIDICGNRVILGSNEELFSREFTVGNTNFMGVSEINEAVRCIGKIRYAHKGAECVIEPVCGTQDRLSCRFIEPQRAITPGQSAVFYDAFGAVLAGGIIE